MKIIFALLGVAAVAGVLLFTLLARPRDEQLPICAVHVRLGESIQDAIDRAPFGAVVCLRPGSYAESISITKSLTLRGTGRNPEDVRITGEEGAEAILSIESDGDSCIDVKLGNFTIGAEPEAVYVERYGVLVQGKIDLFAKNITVCMWAPDYFAFRSYPQVYLVEGVRAHMEDCVISATKHHSWGNGVFVAEAVASFANCTISGHSSAGIEIRGSSFVELQNCEFLGNGWGIKAAPWKGTCEVAISDCLITESTWNGISVGENARVQIERTVICDNKKFGLLVYSRGGEVAVDDVTFLDNGADLGGYASPDLRASYLLRSETELIHVVPDGPGLQEALDTVNWGGTVVLGPGTYQGGVIVSKPLTIAGVGPEKTVIQAVPGSEVVLSILGTRLAGGVAVRDLCITGSNGDGIVCYYDDVEFSNVWVTENEDCGLHFTSFPYLWADIEDCRFLENGGAGGEVWSATGSVTVRRTEFSNNSTGFKASFSQWSEWENLTFEECTFRDNWCGLKLWDYSHAQIKSSDISENRGDGLGLRGNAYVDLSASRITNNRGNGISLAEDSGLSMADTLVAGNSKCGVWTYCEECLEQIDVEGQSLHEFNPDYVFTGWVVGFRNTIPGVSVGDGNKLGALCPEYPEEPWPEGFLRGESRGESGENPGT